MVLMDDVWDRARATLALRAGGFVAIALLFVWLPGVVRELAYVAATPAGAVAPIGAAAATVGLIGLVAAAATAFGHLALVAQASEPLPTWRGAAGIAARRFPAYVGLILLVLLAGTVLLAPITIAAAAAYPSVVAMQAGTVPTLTPGLSAFVFLYGVAALLVVLWVEARVLSVLVPVVVNERLGLRSFRRAWTLTRGLTWRILGVILLFAVVVAVALLALRSVVGVALRLILGAGQADLARLLTSIIVALAVAGVWAVVAAFSARLYLSVRDLDVGA